ncbi:MAG: anti-sigma factor, partial [Dehalococcoidia bacterium]|nr:anti-sigma factor [Dehalococcoidia bacterium]
MSWYKVFPVLLAAGILSLLIPLTLVLAQAGSGTVTIMDSDESGSSGNMSDKATISIMNVSSLPEGQAYEGWFVSDSGERKESTGILNADSDGMISHTFMLMSDAEPTGENLFADFNTFVVTIEPVPDDDPGPSHEIALAYTFPAGTIAQIRNLVVSAEGNPEYLSGFDEGTPKG